MMHLTSFYLTFLIVIGLVVVGGVEGTLRLVQFIELRIKIIWIEYRLHRMRIKLKRELDQWKSLD